LQHGDHLSRRDALHIHLGQREIERPFGARSLLQGARIEPAAAYLRHVEGLFADAGHDGLWFETIGIIGALMCPFVRLGVQKPGPLDLARFIDQNAQCLAGTVQAMIEQGRKGRFERMMVYALCHRVDSFVRD
jgi:hypothetical protein